MTSKILQILKEITSVFAYGKVHRQTLSKVATLLARRLDCEVCSIYAYDEKCDRLVLAATEGLNPDIVENFSLAPSEGITGYAFSENEIINIANPQRDPRYKAAKNSGEESFNSMLSCPLVVGGRKYGVINLQSKEEKPFDEELVELIRALSIQLANIIESSKIFRVVAVKEKEEQPKEINDEFFSKKILKGIPANQGLTIGRVFFLNRSYDDIQVLQERHNSNEIELDFLERAIKAAKKETTEMGEKALSMISEADASIFSVHLLFLEDKSILEKIRKLIASGATAEFAVKKTCDEYLTKFERMDSEIFREKAADLKDVMIHLIKEIRRAKGICVDKDKSSTLPDSGKCIIASRELLPSDILRIPISNVAGYICEKGGATAHFAILARALNIPAMMGVRNMSLISEGDKIILDCYAGNIYINPDKNTETRFIEVIKAKTDTELESDFEEAKTTDGEKIQIMSNLSLLSELPIVKSAGADGIGLYRSEFVYMIRDFPPSEESQIRIYSNICSANKGLPVTFRILDAGSDKPLPYLNFEREENPAMGLRGIRLIENNEEIFKTQISAILRASTECELRILVPMVSSLGQIRKIKKMLSEISTSLSSKGLQHFKNPKIGIMIEIPSMVFSLEKLLNEIDFASIGTNDLMQFFFASDRTNELLSSYTSYYDPAFLKMLKLIGYSFLKSGKKLCICGEMASDENALPLLVGAGISELSLNPRLIARIKKLVRSFARRDAQNFLEKCLEMESADEVKSACEEFFITCSV